MREKQVPYVSVLIPAFNEIDYIEETVRNKLSQEYPHDRIEVIVISDESTDGTDECVSNIADEDSHVSLIRQEPRRGKAAGLNLAIKNAKGDIIVFSDANSLFDSNAIAHITENFSDESVGYLTGELNYTVSGNAASEHGSDAYMKFENTIRTLETDFYSVIGVNGGVDAIRKSLYKDIPADLITDFVLPLHVLDQGKRVIFDSRIKCYEKPNDDVSAEFRMRVRVALRALRGLEYMKRLMNPFRNLKVAFCLISHKLIRYFGPIFMILAFVSNAMLFNYSNIYAELFYMQLVIYLIAIIGLSQRLPEIVRKVTKIPTYFLISNSAFLVALIKLFKGETMAVWKPRQG